MFLKRDLLQIQSFFLVLCIVYLPLHSSYAQVSNDSARNAKRIETGEIYLKSTTVGATVETECIDRDRLADKIIFHNDQWFWFKPKKTGTQYFAIKNQDCKDIRGVQAIVLKGEICRPATHNYLEIKSFGTQDDIYFKVDNLQKDSLYYLIIDGYLHDLCEFELKVSPKKPEFAIDDVEDIQVEKKVIYDSAISFNWEINDPFLLKSIDHFLIKRRHEREKRSYRVGEILPGFNSVGNRSKRYTFYDTVYRTGIFHYQVIAVNEDSKLRLKTFDVKIESGTDTLGLYTLKFDSKKKQEGLLLVVNPYNSKVLLRRHLYMVKGENYVNLNLKHLIEKKIFRYHVAVREAHKKMRILLETEIKVSPPDLKEIFRNKVNNPH